MTYASPYGRTEGIAARLAEWATILGTDKTKPWLGLGIIEDLRKASEMLGGPKAALPLTQGRAEMFAELAGAPAGQREPSWDEVFADKEKTPHGTYVDKRPMQPDPAVEAAVEEWETEFAAKEYDL